MDNIYGAMKEVIHSKEFKKLHECTNKHCEKYEDVILQEKELVNKLSEIQKSMKNISDFTLRLKKSLEMIEITKKLVQLNQKKENLLCVISKCSKEFVDVAALRSKSMEGFYKDSEKKLKDAMKVIDKMKKKDHEK